MVGCNGDPLYVGLQPHRRQAQARGRPAAGPVLPRSKVVCVGKNYADHAAEMGGEVPDEPLIFLKPNTVGDRPRRRHRLSRRRPTTCTTRASWRSSSAGSAATCRAERRCEVIFGYTIANDVTARDLQKRDGQWARAKGFDTFCPLGPWIETELDADRPARSPPTVNGEPQQAGRTTRADLRHPRADRVHLRGHDAAARRRHPHRHPGGVGPMQRRRRGLRRDRGHRHADQHGDRA